MPLSTRAHTQHTRREGETAVLAVGQYIVENGRNKDSGGTRTLLSNFNRAFGRKGRRYEMVLILIVRKAYRQVLYHYLFSINRS